jgi:hypothetical protein
MAHKTEFGAYKKYLRRKKPGDIFRSRDYEGLSRWSRQSVNRYRSMFVKAGYLRMIKPGVYIIEQTIPADISTTQLLNSTYVPKQHLPDDLFEI